MPSRVLTSIITVIRADAWLAWTPLSHIASSCTCSLPAAGTDIYLSALVNLTSGGHCQITRMDYPHSFWECVWACSRSAWKLGVCMPRSTEVLSLINYSPTVSCLTDILQSLPGLWQNCCTLIPKVFLFFLALTITTFIKCLYTSIQLWMPTEIIAVISDRLLEEIIFLYKKHVNKLLLWCADFCETFWQQSIEPVKSNTEMQLVNLLCSSIKCWKKTVWATHKQPIQALEEDH